MTRLWIASWTIAGVQRGIAVRICSRSVAAIASSLLSTARATSFTPSSTRPPCQRSTGSASTVRATPCVS